MLDLLLVTVHADCSARLSRVRHGLTGRRAAYVHVRDRVKLLITVPMSEEL